MGGYGAFRIGLSKPEMFAGVAGPSGACDIRMMAETVKKMPVIEGDQRALFRLSARIVILKMSRTCTTLQRKLQRCLRKKQPRIALYDRQAG